MRSIKQIGLLTALLFLGMSHSAFAVCSNPAGVAGEQIYNADHSVMQYCDGTDWTAMKGDGAGGGADNLGNHTATQNLSIATHKLVGSGTEGIVIDATGEVGVGVSVPLAKVHIGSSGTGTSLLQAQLSSGNPGLELFENGSGDALLTVRDSAGLVHSAFRKDLAYLMATNVGIGTLSPATKLDIEGAGVARMRLINQNLSGNNHFSEYQLGDTTDRSWSIGYYGSNNVSGANQNRFYIWQYRDDAGTFVDTARFVIDDSGNIGMGDNTPDTGLKLDVEGKVGATEYCDENGANCTAAASLGGATTIDELLDAEVDTVGFNMFIGHEGGGSYGANNQKNLGIGLGALDSLDHASSTAPVSRGKNNVAIGYNSLTAVTSGHNNTAIGSEALMTLGTVGSNTAVGVRALTNSTGPQNTAIGGDAMSGHLTGGNNTAVGRYSLRYNETSAENTAIGQNALQYPQAGNQNTALGSGAGRSVLNHTIQNNVFIGWRSGYGVRTGADNNTVIGHNSAQTLTTGANNIIIGKDIDVSAATASNELNIGNILFGSGVGTTAGSKIGAVEYCDENLANCTAAASLVGGTDTLASLSCSATQVAKWNGSAWACAADVGGGAGDDLGNHTATQALNMNNFDITGAEQVSASLSSFGNAISGTTTNTVGAAIYGTANSATGTTYGVHGQSASASGFGGYFHNTNVGGFSLGLGDGDMDAGSNKIVNLVNPTTAQDAATKAYVDSTVAAAPGDNLGAGGSGDLITDGTIDSSEIENNTLTAADLAPNSVDSSEIAADAVTAAKIATDAVRAAEIQAGAVGASEIADGTVVATTELSATGTTNATTFLRGDNTWAVPSFTETDPQVAAVTSGQWCRGTGSAVTCDQAPPSGDNLGSGGTTTGTLFSTNASRTVGRDTNDFIRFDDNAQAFWQINGQWEYQFYPTNFSPYVNADKSLGLSSKRWNAGWFSGAVTAGSFAGNGAALTALAGDNITDGTIDSSEIQDNTLTAADLAAGSVGASEIATDAVRAAEIQAGAVGTSEIADGSVTSTDIANNTITETDIIDTFVARNSQLLDGINSPSFVRSDANDNISANTEWQDGFEARFGNGADFRIRHDGANSVLRSYLHGSQVYFQGENAGGTNRTMIWFDPDNEVRLYYGGAEKLNTRSNGIEVTGEIYATGTYYYGDNKRMFQFSDSWLRLNQNGDFTSGTYTPGLFRADNGFQVDGISVINGSGTVVGSRVGSGVNGDNITNGTIDSSEIQDNTLTAADLGAGSVAGSEVANGSLVATTELSATGTKNSTTFLRGDNKWATPPGGGANCGGRQHMQIYRIAPGSGCGSGPSVDGIGQCRNGTNTTIIAAAINCGGSCFTGETLILLADGSQKPIEDIIVGDIVVGQGGVHNTVTEIEVPPLASRLLYSFNGGDFFVTHEHPFMLDTGQWASISPDATEDEKPTFDAKYGRVKPLEVGDTIVMADGGKMTLETIESKGGYEYDLPVYNLFLDGNNTYFANGFLVHNKN